MPVETGLRMNGGHELRGRPGELLRGYRERLLLTQKQLADRAGLNVRTVRRLEQVGAVSAQQIGSTRRLADALELDADERAAILGARRATAAPARTPDGEHSRPAVVPRQLPAATALFTGRAAELAELSGVVGDTRTLVITAIDGMAGVGKTALALQLAHRVSAAYPDGQLYIDLLGHSEGAKPLDPGSALERLLGALLAPGERVPQAVDDRATLLRHRLAGKRMLIVLDNAADQNQVEQLVPGTSGCLVVITSRRRLTGLDSTRVLSLDVLPHPEAVALLRRVVGEERMATEPPDAVDEIVELCGGLPLAVRVAAARLRSRPSWTARHLADRLRGHHRQLGELRAGERSVAGALALSYRQLAERQRRTYRLLGLHPGLEFDDHAAAALAGCGQLRAQRDVEELFSAHLLQEHRPGRYRFHDLVRAHAALLAADDEPVSLRRAAVGRLLDHYRDTAALAMAVVYPYEPERRPALPSTASSPIFSAETGGDWLDEEMPNLLAVQMTPDAEHTGHAIQLSVILRRHLRTRGSYGVAERVHTRALDVAVASGDRQCELDALCGRGPIRRLQGLHDTAIDDLTRALAIARRLDSHIGQVDALGGIGHVQLMQSRHQEAADHFRRALEVARAAADHNGIRETLTGIGWVNHVRGRPTTAEFVEAIAIARTSGHPAVGIPALTGLGHVHRRQGRPAEAGQAFEEALRLSRATGNPIGEIDALLGLGHLHRAAQRRDRALDCYEQILVRARSVGSRNFQFEALHALGRLHLEAGSAHDALSAHEQALAFAVDLEQPAEQARAHDGIAQVHAAQGDRERAGHHWRTALEILSDLGLERTEDGVNTEVIRSSLRKCR